MSLVQCLLCLLMHLQCKPGHSHHEWLDTLATGQQACARMPFSFEWQVWWEA